MEIICLNSVLFQLITLKLTASKVGFNVKKMIITITYTTISSPRGMPFLNME